MWFPFYLRTTQSAIEAGGWIGLSASFYRCVQETDKMTPKTIIRDGIFVSSCYMAGRVAGLVYPISAPIGYFYQ